MSIGIEMVVIVTLVVVLVALDIAALLWGTDSRALGPSAPA